MKDTTGVAINTNVTGVAKDTSVTPLAKDTTLVAQTSGATIATDVSNTGVPLLSKSSVIFNNLSHVITHAAPQWAAFSLSAISKPTYEIFFTAGTMAADAQPWVQISLFWFDSTSGQQLAQQDYVLAVGTTTALQYHGIGPIHGNLLSIIVTNLGAASSMTVGLQVLNNSNPALNEIWRSEVTAPVNGAGLGLMNSELPANYLAGSSLSILTGAVDSRLLPFYMGVPANFRINTTSNTTDCEAQLVMPPSMVTALGLTALTGNNVIADWNSDSKGLIQQIFNMPRYMCQLAVVNHNAGAQTITRVMTGTV
jgi:hypothetical protein